MTSKNYSFTDYFEQKVLIERPYLKKEWCTRIVDAPIRREVQPDGERVRFWAGLTNSKKRCFVW